MDGTRRTFSCGEGYRPTGSVDLIWRVSRCKRPYADDIQALYDIDRRGAVRIEPVLIALLLAAIAGAGTGLWFAR